MVVLLMKYQLQYSSNIKSHSLEIFRRVVNAHQADLLIEIETEPTTQSCTIVYNCTDKSYLPQEFLHFKV